MCVSVGMIVVGRPQSENFNYNYNMNQENQIEYFNSTRETNKHTNLLPF